MLNLVAAVAVVAALECGGDLPPLGLARCLPTREHALAQVSFSGRWKEAGNGSVFDWNHGEWCWLTIAEAQAPELGPTARREKIKALIDWYGWETVLTGNFPPPVPLYLIPQR